MIARQVVQFSCGAASAVAAKLTLAVHPAESTVIVNAFIEEEHPDNRRFAADCQRWFGHPITILKDEDYGASTLEVWRRKRFIKGQRGAPCSAELKRKVLAQVSLPGDVKVIGFTVDEGDRADALQDSFPMESFSFPLIEASLNKLDCFAIVERAGIRIPEMYRMGYDNANCIGCPKGGQAYWQNIREDFPEQFVQISRLQQEIGPGSYFLRFRSGDRKDERMALTELPPGRGEMAREPDFSCSFFCDATARMLAAEVTR